jgi:hypothetical protein
MLAAMAGLPGREGQTDSVVQGQAERLRSIENPLSTKAWCANRRLGGQPLTFCSRHCLRMGIKIAKSTIYRLRKK